MRAAVALAEGDGDLGDGGFTVGVQKLGTVGDDGAVLLLGARKEAGNVHEGDERNVEGVAKTYEAGGLAAGVDVQHAGEFAGLVGHDAHAAAVHVRKAHDDILGKVFMHFEELPVVHNAADDLIHVIGFVGVVGNNTVEGVLHAVHGVGGLHKGRRFHIVLGQEAQERLDGLDGFFFRIGRKMGYAALAGMHGRAAQLLLVNVLAGDALHDGRAGEEHVGGVFDHEGEVCKGGGVNRTAGAGAHDGADLGNNAAGEDVPLEDFPVAGEGVDALLDAGAAAVVEADAGCPVTKRHVHDLADFLAHGLGQGASAHGEVLGENVHQAAADGAATGDDSVSVGVALFHPEVGAAMLHEHVILFETARVQQHLQALAGRFLAFGVLGFDALFAAAQTGFGTAFHQFLDIL